MSKLSQSQKLIRRLKTGKHMTTNEAKSRYGINRLSARIYDLREAGFPIFAEKYVVRGGVNRGKCVTAYSLEIDSTPKWLLNDSYWFA